MKNNTKKIVGAVICASFICLLWVAYAALLVFLVPELPAKAKIAIAVAFIIPTVVLIGVTSERVKEIRSGIEDDLGKY